MCPFVEKAATNFFLSYRLEITPGGLGMYPSTTKCYLEHRKFEKTEKSDFSVFNIFGLVLSVGMYSMRELECFIKRIMEIGLNMAELLTITLFPVASSEVTHGQGG